MIQKLFILLICVSVFGQNSTSIYLNPRADVDSRVADLMSRMTLEEKVGQMCQYVGLEYLKKQKRNKKAAGNVSMLNKDAFAFYDREMKYKAEEGDFNILVGNAANLAKLKKTTIQLTKNIYINEN